MSFISKQSSVTSTAEGRKAPSPVSSSEVRLVLLGKTTTGKSSTANSILGRRAFKSKVSSFSINEQCRRTCGDFHGRHITLMDTPASVDRQQTSKEVQRELRRCVTLLFPGVHAFLLVLQIGRFTQEEREAVRLIEQALGPRALEFSVVVFTHQDGLDEGMSVRDCPMQWPEGLAELVAMCGGRYCTFSNHTSKTKDQVAVLLNLVDSISEANRGSLYTCKMLRELCDAAEEKAAQVPQQEKRLERVKEVLQAAERKEAMREWYQRELEAFNQNRRQMEDMKRNQQMEREMETTLARERVEDNDKIEKERQIQDMARVMEIRQEEETKREALQEQLEEVIKTLKEQQDMEGSTRREVENLIQRDRAQHEKKEIQWQLQQLEREQSIRQSEEVKREALQNELDRLTQIIEEQSRREEQSARQREELTRNEREKCKREKERELEKQKEERKKRETLQHQLRLVTMKAEDLQQQLRVVTLKVEEQKAKEAKLNRELNESLQREMERCEICTLRDCNVGRSEQFDGAILKWPAAEHTSAAAFVRPVTGYPREMGLLVLNAALETIGAPCCIQ